VTTLTVAICTWNRAQGLAGTLDQLTRLVPIAGHDWELLVVNNNCTDDTDAVCARYVDRLPIRVLHEPTPGQSFARNLAIAEARGKFIIWTDDDVLPYPEWLRELHAAFEQSGADWVFGPSEPAWPDHPPSWFTKRFEGYFAVLDYGGEPFLVTDMSKPFFGLNFAGTRAAHLALNGFRTEFGFKGNKGGVGEDVDLFQRAMAAGMKVFYTPRARVRHVIPPDRTLKQYHRRRQWVANPVYYRYLGEIFPSVRWSGGLPRFFYANAARDAVGYLRCLITRRRSDRFHYELQLLRFIRLFAEAAKHGFANQPSGRKVGPVTGGMPQS
jgi:glycosyltransferase involved in cell wall biosynthesis